MSGVNNRPIAAAISMLSAMCIIGFIDNFVTVISQSLGLWQLHAMRSTFMAPLLVVMSLLGLGVMRPENWRPVLARAVVLSTSMMLYFGSLGLMPIAQALAGLFTSPIFVLLINVLVMGQRIGRWRILAVFAGFAGILLVLQPGGDGFSLWMVMPVAAGFFYAISAIATRSWCAGESALSLLTMNMLVLGVIGGVMSVVLTSSGWAGDTFLSRGWTWSFADALPWIALQAVGSVIGVFLIIRAYQMDEPTNVAVFEYSIMVFAPFFAWILFEQNLGLLEGVGIAMIVSSGLIIALRSQGES
ncbi:DMT family transporter [Pelagimonas sp. KU-00592-HH]|uniref:DMT family transporter n=1 Tax=Roseobacteraceae TaxID=2854170 RepID=UPI0020CBA922|nr:DMT family transporter [Shimia sp. CNT1-13L.2]MCP9483705.1 DMT family transporter [Shimia sp. CNT1-13L.2]